MKKLLLGIVVVFFTLSPVISAQRYTTGKTYKITILHTNDHHGHFWKSRHGEFGLAAQKTLVDRIRKEVGLAGGFTLLLSAGDINTGVPESDLQDAEPDFRGMSLLRYDAMAIGNHEFDNPLDVLAKQKTWAQFPFLSATVTLPLPAVFPICKGSSFGSQIMLKAANGVDFSVLRICRQCASGWLRP